MSRNPGDVDRIRQRVADEWQSPTVAAAYRRWSREEAEWGRAARDLMVARARLAPGMKVLDIGSAHGEPGLGMAGAVGPGGEVALTDVAPGLLEIAAERARAMGLTNVRTQVADGHDLPFEDGTFDRVTCRLAAMYFADHQQAFGEALRVLKRDGRAVYLAWGSLDQPMFRDVLGVLFQYVTPEDDPDAPSPFVFSEPGSLSAVLRRAGFVDVEEENITLPTTFSGPPDQWWQWLHDGAAPVQAWMASLSDDIRRRAVGEIHEVLGRFHDGKSVSVPINVNVASARRDAERGLPARPAANPHGA